jgi:ketosteroid isomerase-like protein
MPSSARTRGAGHEPADLYAIIQDAVNEADLDAFVAAHDGDATVVIPPNGAVASGHAEIRAAMLALLALQPHLTLAPTKALQSDGLALAHGRWQLTVVDDGSRIELSGLGTMVSRRCGDGSWRVVLDDPLTGP